MMRVLRSIEEKFWNNRRSNTNPSIFQHDFLFHKGLYHDIKKTVSKIRRENKKKEVKIVDVGCGEKPYKNLFSPFAKHYVGVDIEGTDVDVIASAENLPFNENSFDIALSFQVLEHLENPEKSIREIRRVLKKGGVVFASTHGIWNYHPNPSDYYRWTQDGLANLFKEFSDVSITPNLLSIATVLQIMSIELYTNACRNIFLKLPFYGFIVLINIIGNPLLKVGTKDIVINYLVTAKK